MTDETITRQVSEWYARALATGEQMVISNCVINLAPDKAGVFREM